MNAVALEVEDLQVRLNTHAGTVYAVDGVSLTVHRGEAVALVGESGCGKSMTAVSIMKLAPAVAQTVGGSVRLADGSDVMTMTGAQLRAHRGSSVGMMFQDPSSYLSPLIRIGDQIAESLTLHGKADSTADVGRVLTGVGLDTSVRTRYPHELSGGMRQRALLAVAIACSPDVLIADEPTTALDVTIQHQVLLLLAEMRVRGMGILLITHDLPIVADFCDRVYVMYAGQIVEEADVFEIFENPRHPYTQGLLAASRSLNGESTELETIEGTVPDLRNPAPGCRFAPRCRYAKDVCSTDPPVQRTGQGTTRCWIGTAEYGAMPTGEEVGAR